MVAEFEVDKKLVAKVLRSEAMVFMPNCVNAASSPFLTEAESVEARMMVVVKLAIEPEMNPPRLPTFTNCPPPKSMLLGCPFVLGAPAATIARPNNF